MEHSMPLVFFTFLSELAIGAFATLFLLDVFKKKFSQRSARDSLISILVVSVLAVFISLFHLGHPFSAIRAILNFGHSWLTREITFFPLFILFVLLYTIFGKNKPQKQIFGWIGVVFGLATIFSTSMCYNIPSVPAWHNGTTIAAFFITALLLGPVSIYLMLAILDKNLLNMTVYTAIMAAIAIIINLIHVSVLKGGLPAAVQSSILILASPLFWIKMVALIVAFVISEYFALKKKGFSVSMVGFIFACFIVSEFLGRILFYSSGIHL